VTGTSQAGVACRTGYSVQDRSDRLMAPVIPILSFLVGYMPILIVNIYPHVFSAKDTCQKILFLTKKHL
jgi:hypothetical protein